MLKPGKTHLSLKKERYQVLTFDMPEFNALYLLIPFGCVGRKIFAAEKE